MNKTIAAALAATLAVAAVHAADGRLDYRIAAKSGSAAFTCAASPTGQCTVAVGLPAQPQPALTFVAQGTTVSLPDPDGQLRYCVSSASQVDWPNCLGTDGGNRLSTSTSSRKFQWDAAR